MSGDEGQKRRPSRRPVWERSPDEARRRAEAGEFNPWGSQMAWEREQRAKPAAQTTHPAPLVPCRVAAADEVPRAAVLMQRRAERAGWRVVPTFALGWYPGAKLTLTASVALRMRRADHDALGPMTRAAVAVWTRPAVAGGKWSFSCAFRWDAHGDGRREVTRIGAPQLSAYVSEPVGSATNV